VALEVRPAAEADRGWVRELLRERWGSPMTVRRGETVDAAGLSAFLALEGDRPVGLATYAVRDGECELVTIDALEEGRGVGSALLEAVRAAARAAGCSRLWLVTTNDNLRALRFYQRRGFALTALRPGALAESRRLKPSIPAVGLHGIPLRDELELELDL